VAFIRCFVIASAGVVTTGHYFERLMTEAVGIGMAVSIGHSLVVRDRRSLRTFYTRFALGLPTWC